MAVDPQPGANADDIDQRHHQEGDEVHRQRDRSPNAEKAPAEDSPVQVERDRIQEDRFEATDN